MPEINEEKTKSLYGEPNEEYSTKVKKYTIIAYTENLPGLLHRVITIFTRRKVNIENINVSQSEIKELYRYTIVIKVTEKEVQTITKQLERIVEVIRAMYMVDEDLVHQEIALYKVPTAALMGGSTVEKLVRKHNARILEIEKEFVIIEKSGHKAETQALFEVLEPFGLLEFSRSGRVALTKPRFYMHEYLQQMEESMHEATSVQ